MESKFLRPVYVGDTLTVSGVVKEKEEACRMLIVKLLITDQRGEKVSKGQMQHMCRRRRRCLYRFHKSQHTAAVTKIRLYRRYPVPIVCPQSGKFIIIMVIMMCCIWCHRRRAVYGFISVRCTIMKR